MKEYPQRSAYMAGEVSFTEFYESVAKEAGISYENSSLLPRIKHALAAGDEHLNTIPLSEWNSMAAMTYGPLKHAFKLHGDTFSLAGGVCVHKAAAKKAAREST